MKRIAMISGVLAIAMFVAAQFVSIFVIQPIGAIPDGVTLVITRFNTLRFIDSADAWCEREASGVSLLCRMGMMGRVANTSKVLMRLPYFDSLYSISTGGKRYDR